MVESSRRRSLWALCLEVTKVVLMGSPLVSRRVSYCKRVSPAPETLSGFMGWFLLPLTDVSAITTSAEAT